MEEKEVTINGSLQIEEVEESPPDTQSDESIETETSSETSDFETSAEVTTYETTTTAVTVAVNAESLNSFTRSANYLMCFFVIYFVCKALYRLINIFF